MVTTHTTYLLGGRTTSFGLESVKGQVEINITDPELTRAIVEVLEARDREVKAILDSCVDPAA